MNGERGGRFKSNVYVYIEFYTHTHTHMFVCDSGDRKGHVITQRSV